MKFIGITGGVGAGQRVVARRRSVDEAQDVEQGGLPGSRASHDGHVLAGGDAQVDSREDLQGLGVGNGEGAGDLPQLQQPAHRISLPSES